MYVYRATVNRVIDGDTIDVTVDLGFCASLRQTVRLYGINAPELHGASVHAGRDARDYLAGLLPTGTQVLIQSFKADGKADKYGRWLGKIGLPDGTDVNREMLQAGHAVEYMT